jgi:hypothetical protein
VKPRRRTKGFTLLPVVLAMTLIASIAFLLNRSNALNANMVASRADLERARYAAEAGLQAVNYVIQQAGCTGTYPTAGSPLVEPNFAGSAYSAYAGAPFGSPLTLTSTGTHNGTSVTLSRGNAYVYQAGIKTYALQPNALSGIDAYVEEGKRTENFGDSGELKIDHAKRESLLKFDLSILPAGSRVVPLFDTATGRLGAAAVLEIYKKSGGSPSSPSYIDAHLIGGLAWIEGVGGKTGGVTWEQFYPGGSSTSPGYDARVISTNLSRASDGWQLIDLTDAVRAWMGSVYPNNGVWLRSSPSGAAMPDTHYYSSDDGNAALRPRLTLRYLLPCWVTAP